MTTKWDVGQLNELSVLDEKGHVFIHAICQKIPQDEWQEAPPTCDRCGREITCVDEAVGPCNAGSLLLPGMSVCSLIDPDQKPGDNTSCCQPRLHNMNSGLTLAFIGGQREEAFKG